MRPAKGQEHVALLRGRLGTNDRAPALAVNREGRAAVVAQVLHRSVNDLRKVVRVVVAGLADPLKHRRPVATAQDAERHSALREQLGCRDLEATVGGCEALRGETVCVVPG